MESVNKVVDAASHAIWGDPQQQQHDTQVKEQHGDEPLSGVQGKGDVTDPYDGGNRDEQPGAPPTEQDTAAVTGPPPESIKDTNLTGSSTSTSESKKPPMTEDHEESGPNGQDISNSQNEQETQSKGLKTHSETKQPEKTQSEHTSTSEATEGYEPNTKVSEEALKGPKNPAPREAYEFEKRMDGVPTKSEQQKTDGNNGGGASKANYEEQNGNDNGHKFSKVKDKLGKVFHHDK